MSDYSDVYARWKSNPVEFWSEAADRVAWIQRWDSVLDSSHQPFYRWFVGGALNTCFNALDRHIPARGDQPALIYDSPLATTGRTLTYSELRDEVARCAGALRGLGVEKGDRVLIFMPNIPEAVVTMLACARLGAVHSVVFGGFASAELATRIDDAQPSVIAWASCGIEPNRLIDYQPLLEGALALASHQPAATVVVQRPQAPAPVRAGRDLDWHSLMTSATPVDECVPVLATDPLYILYTSGTTGRPKGVVRDNGGHAVALIWSMPNIYDVRPGRCIGRHPTSAGRLVTATLCTDRF